MRNPIRHRRSSKSASLLLLSTMPIALLMIMGVACSSTVDKSILQVFAVGAAPTLDIQNLNGSVRVDAGPTGEIRFEAGITRSEFLEYELHQAGNVVTFQSELTSDFTSGNTPKVDIVVTVPPDTILVINTGNGRIDISGSRGSGQLNTGNGDMTFEDTRGDFTGSTGNGDLKISGATGSFDLNSGNGMVELDDVDGSFSVTSGNGEINFDGAFAPGSSNSLSTGNGRVEVNLEGTPDITIDAETKRGQVKNEIDMDILELDEPRHLIGTIGTGAAEVTINTGNGDIVLR